MDENPEFLKLKDENEELKKQLEFWKKLYSTYYDSFHRINEKYRILLVYVTDFLIKKKNFIDKCFIDNCINEQKLSQQIKEGKIK